MSKYNSHLEILKFLEKSNCRECGEATCLAFAAAVFKGWKELTQCPRLEKEVLNRFAGKAEETKTLDQNREELVSELKRKVAAMDLAPLAPKLGGRFSHGKLSIPILGKEFSVDSEGNFSSAIHINAWVAGPVLDYIIKGAGVPVSGKWVPLRELKGGKTWEQFFGHQCEKPLKRVADNYTNLFEDMLHIFNGKQVENHYNSDISLVLHPLPKVPVLICYWRPEDGMESELHLFFDETAADNLNIESIYTLGTGLVRMFQKIALTHGPG